MKSIDISHKLPDDVDEPIAEDAMQTCIPALLALPNLRTLNISGNPVGMDMRVDPPIDLGLVALLKKWGEQQNSPLNLSAASTKLTGEHALDILENPNYKNLDLAENNFSKHAIVTCSII